jgi:hypothetical protein
VSFYAASELTNLSTRCTGPVFRTG